MRNADTQAHDATMNRFSMISGVIIVGAIALMMAVRDPARGPGDTAPAIAGAGQGTAPTPSVVSPPSGTPAAQPEAPTPAVKAQPNLQPATPPR